MENLTATQQQGFNDLGQLLMTSLGITQEEAIQKIIAMVGSIGKVLEEM